MLQANITKKTFGDMADICNYPFFLKITFNIIISMHSHPKI